MQSTSPSPSGALSRRTMLAGAAAGWSCPG